MIKTVLIDDEPKALGLLESYFKKYFGESITITQTFTNSLEALGYLKSGVPIDLLVVDINMPMLNGIDLLSAFPERKCEVIFVTAYAEFAIQAFKLKALDYMLKPINRVEFIESVKVVVSRIEKLNTSFGNQQENEYKTQKFGIKNGSDTEFVDMDSLIYLKADGSYTSIQTTKGVHLISKNLKQTMLELNSELFIRINRSFAVNINHIISYSKRNDGSVTLSNNYEVGISRGMKKKVFNQLQNR